MRPHRAVQPGALTTAGLAVAAVAGAAYLAAIATHPRAALLKGFDLQVYLGGARQALDDQGQLYHWTYLGHPGIQFTYTPFAALVFATGLRLPFSALMGLVTALSVAALAVTTGVTFRALGWRGRSWLGATLLVAGLALWTEPVQRALFLGQVELVLMALVTWDLCPPPGRRRRWQGAATGLAAGIKLVPLLFIVYLLLTGRRRPAAVAAGVFAATVAAGFAVLPRASVTWWLGGDFLAAGRTGFVGGGQNQSLRGLVTRLAGSVHGGALPWLLLAVAAGLAGLAAAVALDRAGHPVAGVLGCALTALLVSPISWDHHWVWIAPGLALAADAGTRARRGRALGWPALGWFAGAGVAWAVFAAWPDFWSRSAGLLGGGLINDAPVSAWAYGDNPAYREYHWHGLQLVAGNTEVLAGLALFAVLLAAACRGRTPAPRRRPRRAEAAGSGLAASGLAASGNPARTSQ
jgi:alpha-1,2-mannosyltransferase